MSIAERLETIESLLRHALGLRVVGPRRLLTSTEFGQAVGRNRSTVIRYCQRGQIQASRSINERRGPGFAWRIPVAEVQRFLDEGPLPVAGGDVKGGK